MKSYKGQTEIVIAFNGTWLDNLQTANPVLPITPEPLTFLREVHTERLTAKGKQSDTLLLSFRAWIFTLRLT